MERPGEILKKYRMSQVINKPIVWTLLQAFTNIKKYDFREVFFSLRRLLSILKHMAHSSAYNLSESPLECNQDQAP